MIKLSGVIITFNEERDIERCLQSLVNVVEEIVVVDSYSTDNTKSICQKYNVTFIEQKFLGYIFDIGLLSFNDGTDPMDKFVPNVIDDKHFIFPLFH